MIELAMRGACVICLVALSAACTEPAVYEPAEPLDARTMALWSDSCALCHVAGEAGAPRTGIFEDWQPRLEQGGPVLLRHTIEGFNMMPPLGYCMGCEAADFDRMIEFMAGVKLETGS